MFKNKKILVIIVVTIIILFIGVSRIRAQKLNQPTVYNQNKDTIVSPEIKSIKSDLTLTGSIDASEYAPLRFQNSGKLVWVGVKIGNKVKKGQAIASLDKAELQKSLQTQYNNYRSQLSQFWDTQDKYKDVVVSDTVQRILNRTQYSLDNSVISYEIADMAIKESTLVSPINGVVVAVDQPLSGTNITPASATFTIINPESIFLKAEIDQDQVSKIKVGQKAVLTIDAFPEQTFDSEITYIAFTPVAGESSTVYEVRFKVPVQNKDLSYRIGMNGDATVTLDQKDNTIVVSLDALNDDNGKSFVWIKNGNSLAKKYVETGIENDTEVEILSGLDKNDQIVIKKI